MVHQPVSIFERYPLLNNLRGKVPEDVIQREINRLAEEFEYYRILVQEKISTVSLSDVFPQEVEEQMISLGKFLGRTGNVTIEELCKICLIARWLRPKAVFEFGTYNGLTTLQLAINVPSDCKVYTVDLPPNSDSIDNLEIGEYDRYLIEKRKGVFYFQIGEYFLNTKYKDKIVQLWGDSKKIDLSQYYNSIDLVFVDASHEYTYVRSDTENALKMLHSHGVIIWHDFLNILHAGVTRCLYEYTMAGLSIYHLRGTNLAVHYHKP